MKKAKTSSVPAPLKPDTSQSVRLEKIENGFLAHHETSGPKGYQVKKVFHPTAPKITVGVQTPARKKPSPKKINYPKF